MATRKEQEQEVPEVMTNRELNKANQESSGQELVPAKFDREQLGGIDSFDAAIALAVAEYGDVIDAADQPLLGDGFRVATEDDKRNKLVGVPLLLLNWTFRGSDYGTDEDTYVSVQAIQREENGGAVKWIINDGGTGIARDLREFTQKTGRDGGMICKTGLRVSDYVTDQDTGVPLTKKEVRQYMIDRKAMGQGHTFYLDA